MNYVKYLVWNDRW